MRFKLKNKNMIIGIMALIFAILPKFTFASGTSDYYPVYLPQYEQTENYQKVEDFFKIYRTHNLISEEKKQEDLKIVTFVADQPEFDYGDDNYLIREYTKTLNSFGYKIKEQTKYDKEFAAAIKQFQFENEVDISGVFDKNTICKILKHYYVKNWQTSTENIKETYYYKNEMPIYIKTASKEKALNCPLNVKYGVMYCEPVGLKVDFYYTAKQYIADRTNTAICNYLTGSNIGLDVAANVVGDHNYQTGATYYDMSIGDIVYFDLDYGQFYYKVAEFQVGKNAKGTLWTEDGVDIYSLKDTSDIYLYTCTDVRGVIWIVRCEYVGGTELI